MICWQGSSISVAAMDGHESQLVWRNLTLSLSNGKVLIDNVDGIARGGRCLSLMGPSGAGIPACSLGWNCSVHRDLHVCVLACR
jgi:hypothetical protein